MKDWTTIQERYLRDALPIRLGGLAANLARITSFSKNDANYHVVESLLDESKFFIEWTANETNINTAAELVELQVQLARWQFTLTRLWTDQAQRLKLADQSSRWSDRVLEFSGLLDEQGAGSESQVTRS
jgi:hypothetical protein